MKKHNLKKSLSKEKNLKQKKEFPSITRFITEQFRLRTRGATRKFWLDSIVVLSSMFLIFQSIQVYEDYQEKIRTDIQWQHTVAKLHAWEGFMQKHPDYRDGYFQLSLISYTMGDLRGAQKYLQEVFIVDPNYMKAREFENFLYSIDTKKRSN